MVLADVTPANVDQVGAKSPVIFELTRDDLV